MPQRKKKLAAGSEAGASTSRSKFRSSRIYSAKTATKALEQGEKGDRVGVRTKFVTLGDAVFVGSERVIRVSEILPKKMRFSVVRISDELS